MSDDTNTTDAAEELLQQSKEQSRHTTEPTTTDDTPDRQTAIKEALLAIEDGDTHGTLTVRDGRLKGLMVGLEKADGLDDVAQQVDDRLEIGHDIDLDGASQSGVAALLIRAGLEAHCEEVLAEAREAKRAADEERAGGF